MIASPAQILSVWPVLIIGKDRCAWRAFGARKQTYSGLVKLESYVLIIQLGKGGCDLQAPPCGSSLVGLRLVLVSSLVPIFKGNGDPLNPKSYRGIKLLEHAFKLYEVLDGRLREVVDIDKMQCEFLPGRRTVDAVFVLRRLNAKFRAKNKKLFFVFVDLEKAFD